MKYLKLALTMTCAAAALLGWSVLQAQTVYRITGSDGKVTFSDKPPAAEKANVTARNGAARTVDGSPQNASLPYELRQVVARFPVTLYSSADCVPCNAGRLLLQARGVPHAEYTVASPDDVESLQRLSGDKSIPFVTIGGQKIKGYSESEWRQFLDAAGYPATSQLPGNFRNPAPRPLVAAKKIAPPAEAPEAGDAPTAAASPATPAAAAPAATNPAGIKF